MNTLTELMKLQTKKDLITIAKFHQMKGYSSLKKEELASRLGEYLTSPDVAETFFSYLGDEELLALTNPSKDTDAPLLQKAAQNGYCFFHEKTNTWMIPEEISTLIPSSNSFHKKRLRYSFLLNCIRSAESLYGCAPVSIIIRLYNNNSKETITKETFLSFADQLCDYYHNFVIENDLFIPEQLYENALYKKIQQCQGTLSYYLPKREDIIHLSLYGYFSSDISSKKLANYLQDNTSYTYKECTEITGNIQAVFRQGGSILDEVNFLKNNSVLPDDILVDKVFLSLVNELFTNTRLLLSRGYTAAQASHINKQKIKIYPNTPCPCGSGKKYKNCCQKNG